MDTPPPSRTSRIVGWIAVVLSTPIASFWAFWGIVENFHEGWYFESIWSNLGLMIVQYLSIMLVFLALGVVSIAWHRVGSVLHIGLAVLALWILGFHPVTLHSVSGPLVLIALAYWFGRPEPRKWALGFLIGVTLVTFFVSGAEPVWRVLIVGRTDDGDFGARIVEGNDVTLVWAPEGPGWPREGIEWDEAVRRCRYLTEDGLRLANEPQDIWRLPTADEAVRSMHRHGSQCGGEWDGKSAFPKYDVKPDKETPLWNIHSPVIYWWTGTEIDSENAYIVSYNGQVRPRSKTWAPTYLAFRVVKDALTE